MRNDGTKRALSSACSKVVHVSALDPAMQRAAELTGLWIGCDDGAPLRLSAGEVAVPLWSAYAKRVTMSHAPILPPGGVTFREIDPSNGGIYERGCDGPINESYLAGTEPRTTCTGRSLTPRIRVACAEGNPEPSEITGAQSRAWSDQSQGEEPDAPESVAPGGAGRVTQVAENDGSEEATGGPAEPVKHHKVRRHKRHHSRGNGIPSLFRRIFGRS